ncbi:hypothetical protein [Paracidobacterium acidisoli]|uniref:hypothetical protein n=1 Tax=Paracidobacterium acidisoli TaxID=2303751 RepID=UPI00268CF943
MPLEAVLRGIDSAFDRHEARKQRTGGRGTRQVNGLAWCAQEVMTAVEEMKEASVGLAKASSSDSAPGFEQERIARHLAGCAVELRAAKLAELAMQTVQEMAGRLEELAAQTRGAAAANLEELERNLTVLEEKLLTVLVATTPEKELLRLREQSERELAPYRRKMQAVQIRQIEQQFLHKRLLEQHSLPRLSLFYMSQG